MLALSQFHYYNTIHHAGATAYNDIFKLLWWVSRKTILSSDTVHQTPESKRS